MHIGSQLRELVSPSSSGARASDGDENPSLRLLEETLASHPWLGENKVENVLSRAEQAQLQKSGEGECGLERPNALYEETFPELRYLYEVCLLALCEFG